MTSAILFGSIGVLAETSEMQRQAFNHAFADAGLDWQWDEAEYASMLRSSGGKERIENFARDHDTQVDAAAIHARKSELFQESLKSGVSLRPGVADVIAAAGDQGVPLAFVTTTSSENVRQILAATGVPLETFAFVGHRDLVRIGKPSAEIYRLALQHLDVHAEDSIAIEDSAPSARAAHAANVPLVAFPGAQHADDDFGDVVAKTDRLTPEIVGLHSEDRAVA